ncbi:MAG: hypothetical protein PF638_03430 [Candidatus Delongbacteria bacterium]|jgi:hypothetical protein|nr:hypothetical protein [Candidatus Delongbacteria bacterium]
MSKKYIIIFIIILLFSSLFSQYKTVPNDFKIASERWYDWDGTEWIQTTLKNYERDSLGNIGQVIYYYYNAEGNLTSTTPWNCTYYEDYYKIYRSYTWTGYKEGGTYTYTYIYNLDGIKIGYNYVYDYWSIMGGYTNTKNIDYIYSDNKLLRIDEFYVNGDFGNEEVFKTEFNYDDNGRIVSEIKQQYNSDQWIDKTRTLWTYEGDIGTGVTEIYKNTVWIFTGNKFRNLDYSYQTTTEERQFWSWGKWINNEKDYLFYMEDPTKEASLPYKYLVDTQTYAYDTASETYIRDNRHYIYYDDFTPLVTPLNIKSEFLNGKLTLTWGTVNGADGYKIYSSTDPEGTYEIDTTGTFSGSTWTTNLSDQKKFYRITAIRGEK